MQELGQRHGQCQNKRHWDERRRNREQKGEQTSEAAMQRSIKSFFQPMSGDKGKKQEEPPKSSKEKEPACKVALKERNAVEPESESPVKRPARKVARVLGSEGEEEDEEVAPAAPEVQELTLPSPATSPASSDSSPRSISLAGIPKRRTARKQMQKRKLQELPEDHKDSEPKRCKSEGGESTRGRSPEQPPLSPEAQPASKPEEGDQPPKEAKSTAPEPEDMAKEVGQGPEPKESKEPTQMPKEHTKIPKAPKKPTQKPKVPKEPTQSSKEPTQTPKEPTQSSKEPTQTPKTFSSFFTPRKPALAKQASKETESGKADKETSTAPPDPTTYNPSKSGYHPMDDACWKPGQRVPYLAVARTFEKIEEVSARLRMVETLSNLLRSVTALSPADLLPVLYLSLNQLGPPQQGLELGVGDGVLLKAVAQATGRQLEAIRAEVAEKGDVGLVVEASRSTQRTMLPLPPLTATGVLSKLRDIARLTGSASTNKKIDIIKSLFVACRHTEARFIARALSGRLRLGLAEQSVLAALSQAVTLTPPSQEFPPAVVDAGKGKSADARKAWLEEKGLVLKQTFCEVPDLDLIIPALLKHGLDQLPQHCQLTPGVPLKPMLAHPTRGIGEVLKRFEESAFTCEYKYDGQRAQIHVLENGDVKIFSRNQEDNTGRYPDVISRIPKMKRPSVVSCILDSEAVAWDRAKKQIQPFQVLSTRKRKEVEESEIQVQVCLYAFDLIYLNGQSLVREPLSRRRQMLRENFIETEGEFVFATSLDTEDTEQIADFLEQSVKDSCEGLMVKTLDTNATYEIAKRSHNWLKLKKDYLEGAGDTLDLVVIGAYLGRGKRAGRYGGFLLAAFDEDSEEFQAICKLGTGFSDEELEEHYQKLQALVIPAPRSYVRAEGAVPPDHWLEPTTVWEVKCADLSLSPIYAAARGSVESDKGISLRFPRFVRVREDKKPEEATSSTQVAHLYRKQQQIQNQQDLESSSFEPEDFY
ncbi:DNA ligase 1 isoform X3 [Macrotis lagotis]|uniref:DNA ligase 1 isoform X3 n=1 Tax=Macrotis lagotis TaxID=92651 RepID=UPI003D6994F0